VSPVSPKELAAWCVAAGGLSAGLTYLFTRLALATGLLDRPNARSSHERPTPRGGGLAIVLVLLLAVAALAAKGAGGPAHGAWLLLGLGVIAVISGIDDVATISPRVRLLAQVLAAVVATVAAGPVRVIDLGWCGTYDLGPAGWVLAVLWIVGMTNAFNFMDGIDGIAGITAAVALGVMSGGFWLGGDGYGGLLAAAVASAAVGFLVWNWQPARVFMGDVGSASLGYTIAVLPLLAGEEQRSWLLPVTVAVMWPFLLDTTLTFLRRLRNGENVLEAHRSHFYQRLVIGGWSHATVALMYGCASLVGGLAALAAGGV
jgi:UDP-N-acetylmuramyl pentapeptide phosphotransferase/UDP-N-acetylglucosamine-1-phosphate transferase